jgi:hypothetical protein
MILNDMLKVITSEIAQGEALIQRLQVQIDTEKDLTRLGLLEQRLLQALTVTAALKLHAAQVAGSLQLSAAQSLRSASVIAPAEQP